MRLEQKEIGDKNVQDNKRRKMKRKKKLTEHVNVWSRCSHTRVAVSTRYKLTSDDLVLAASECVNPGRTARQFVVMQRVPW